MKSKILFLIFITLTFIFFIVKTSNYIFLPVDILRGLPLFGLNPVGIHNSLLADPVFQFEPWRIFMKESFLQGHLPFWNDLNGNGVPFLANPITSVFSPLNIIYLIFSAKLSLVLIAILKILIFCVGVYYYLRKVNISKEISLLGSLISISGYFILWLNWPQTNVYIFFPFVLLFVERLLEKINLTNFYILSFIFFLAFLSGHPETYFQIALVGILYSFIKNPKRWKSHIFYCLSILTGTLLAGFQLLPFIEYLYYSYALHIRSLVPHNGLNPSYFIFNFVPYVFGAPHLRFYRPLAGTNFQEVSGGYVGIIFYILIFTKFKRILQSSLRRTWLILCIISIFLAYSIPVVTDLIKLTPLGINTNARMIATLGFGVLVIGISILDEFHDSKKLRMINAKIHFFILFFLSLIFIAITSHVLKFFLRNMQLSQVKFIEMFIIFITVVFIGTILCFIILNLRAKFSNYLYIILLIVLVSSQTILLFVSYNTFSNSKLYYPINNAIKILKNRNLPILNIGNVNLSPDINMAYGLKSIENYDAMDIYWYKKYFDKYFPDKNRWGNVDSATFESLKKFGVGSVISDYDINNEKISIQSNSDSVISLSQKASVTVIGNGKYLRQIRFLPATYNRINNCHLTINLVKDNITLKKVSISCTNLYNGMFQTVNIQPQYLDVGEKYQITFNKSGDQIALFGRDKTPYLDLLFDSGNVTYKKLYDRNNVLIYEVPNSATIETHAKIKNVKSSSGYLSFSVEAERNERVLVKKTYFPGWNLTINKLKTNISDKKPFMAFIVPSGRSEVVLKYTPSIFYLGILVSIGTFISLFMVAIVYLFRNIHKWRRAVEFFSLLSTNAQNKSTTSHIVIFTISFIISVTVFLLLCAILKIKFSVPETTAINWLTVNKYPKQQDLIYFAIGFPFVTFICILIWIVFICKQKQK